VISLKHSKTIHTAQFTASSATWRGCSSLANIRTVAYVTAVAGLVFACSHAAGQVRAQGISDLDIRGEVIRRTIHLDGRDWYLSYFYRQAGEIWVCDASILKFAQWIWYYRNV
jgi:hypothetical protein